MGLGTPMTPTDPNPTFSNSSADDPRLALAFPTLAEADLITLEGIGKPVHIPKGDPVWKAGEANMGMFVIVEGEMAIVDGRTGAHVATHPKGHFSGDIDVLSGRPAMVTGLAQTDLDVLKVPADCVRTIVGENPALGELILRAFLMRRTL